MAQVYRLPVADFARTVFNDTKEVSEIDINAQVLDYFASLYKVIAHRLSVSIIGGEITIVYHPESLDSEDQGKLSRAVALLSERRYELGREYLLELIGKYPLNGDILFNLGMSYSEQGDFESSIKPLEKATEVTPFFADAYVALGYSHANLKNYKKAVELNKLALMYDKNSFYAHRNLAACLSSLGRYGEAEPFALKSLRLEPNDPQSLYGYALICRKRGDNETYAITLKKIIDNGINEKIVNLAKDELRKLAEFNLKSKGYRADAVMYLLTAIKMFNDMSKEEIQNIAFGAARMGMNGLDINNPEKTYYFKELGKELTGLQVVCYMYAGFQILDSSVNIGVDLSKEYEAAKGFLNG